MLQQPSMNDGGDERLIDKQTFIDEVQAMERTLYCVARSYLPSWESCADAVQEALKKAWENRATVQVTYFRAWMTRIVINECHNITRSRRRLPVSMAEVPPPPQPDDTDIGLREAIAQLPERLRLPLLLHYHEGFRLEEIATILRLPIGTVKSRLHQARKCLRDVLESEEEHHGGD